MAGQPADSWEDYDTGSPTQQGMSANAQPFHMNAGASSWTPGGGGGYQQQQGYPQQHGYPQQGYGYPQQGYNAGYQQQQHQPQQGYNQRGQNWQPQGYQQQQHQQPHQHQQHQQQQPRAGMFQAPPGFMQAQQGFQQQQQPPAPQPKKAEPKPAPKKPAAKMVYGGGGKTLSFGAKKETKVEPAKSVAKPEAKEAAAEEPKEAKNEEPKQEQEPKEKKEKATAAPETSKPLPKPKARKHVERDPRPHLNVVFIGHVDAGKSTISGHLMYITGQVDDRTLEKYEREAKTKNRESWKYAWAMDVGEEEREKGKTHETGAAYFATKERRFTILDAPGHKAFVPSMIGGACQADFAILVISARKGEFETGFEKGGQTREHAQLVKTAGVRELVVVVNKMDDPSVNWDKARYDEIVTKLTPFLQTTGFRKNTFQFMPISGLGGYNLGERLDKKMCPWFDGPCVMEALNAMPAEEMSEDAPLRLPIQGHFKEMGAVVHGKCESGSFYPGDKLLLLPTKTTVVVDQILVEEEPVEKCWAGDNVNLRLKGIDEEDLRVGYVLCQPEKPLQTTTLFTAQLLVLECQNIITAGYTCVLHLHALVEDCTIASLLCTLDKKTGKMDKKYPQFVKGGDSVLVRVETQNPICLEPYKTFSKMGRFVCRDAGKTIAVGVVTKLIDKAAAAAAAQDDD